MAKRTKVTETWNGKETFLSKKERDAKGHFVKSKPKPVVKKPVEAKTQAKAQATVQKTKNTKPITTVDLIDASKIRYKTVTNRSTGKTYTVGSVTEPKKPATGFWGVPEKVKLWRYNKNSVDRFCLSIDPPSSESNHCELLVTFYDIKRDLLALKRAIAQYEKEIELTAVAV